MDYFNCVKQIENLYLKMEYRKLGKSGLEVSAIGYGDAGSKDTEEDQKKTNEIVKKCFELGINYFDSAELYQFGQHETVLGRALKESGEKRENFAFSKKIFWSDSKNPNNVRISPKCAIGGL